MAVLFILMFIGLVVFLSRKRTQPFIYEELGATARRLYTTIYGGTIADRPRTLSERETKCWVTYQSTKKLKSVRAYLCEEIAHLKPEDWDGYVINTILERSEALTFFLNEEGKLTTYTARERERQGIQDALSAVKRTRFDYPYTLRSYFHALFHNIVLESLQDDRYYYYGQLKVIDLLRSYQASSGMCIRKEKDPGIQQRPQLGVFGRLAMHFRLLEERREKNRIDISRGYPLIEFDLPRIEHGDIYEYQGALLNNLFLHLVGQICRITCVDEPRYCSYTDPLYDLRAASFTYGYGEVYVVKYTGVTGDFPHRLCVEFVNIPINDPLYREMLSMKLHFEGND